MVKDTGCKAGAACGKPQAKSPAPEKSVKKEIKTFKPEKKGK